VIRKGLASDLVYTDHRHPSLLPDNVNTGWLPGGLKCKEFLPISSIISCG
jgi:hypothetical protein